MPGCGGSGLSLEAHEHHHLSAEGLLIELDRLLAAAIEEQVGLDVHSISLSVVGECAPTNQSNDGQQNRQVASIFFAAASSGPRPFKGLFWRLCEVLSRLFLLHDVRLPVASVAELVWHTHRLLPEGRTMGTTHPQACLNAPHALQRR